MRTVPSQEIFKVPFDGKANAAIWFSDGNIHLHTMLSPARCAFYTYEEIKSFAKGKGVMEPYFMDFVSDDESKQVTIHLDGSITFRGEWYMQTVEYLMELAKLVNMDDFKA